VFQKPHLVVAHFNDPENAPVPFGIFKISNNTEGDEKYSVKTVIEDDGSLYRLATIAAVDRKRNVLLFGSFRTKGIVRCDSLEP
jgi:arylesterase/paraoxonase